MVYDYVIVGAGAAGCVLANRLSENPENKVCLLEAGRPDGSIFIKVPAGVAVLMQHPLLNWKYWTTPQKALNNRKIYIPRGKTLGGSSAVNAMCYTRGHKWDFDHWESLGNEGWGYKDMLPLFRRSEHYEAGENEFHGVGGPINVADLQSPMEISKAFVKPVFRLVTQKQTTLTTTFRKAWACLRYSRKTVSALVLPVVTCTLCWIVRT